VQLCCSHAAHTVAWTWFEHASEIQVRVLLHCLLVQMSIIQLYLKRKHRWTDASFNEQCALNHSSRGPGNFYPRSLWLMKKIASVAEAHSIQVGLSCAGWGAGLAFSQVVVTIAPLSGSGAA
jgi:hypothetical protein